MSCDTVQNLCASCQIVKEHPDIFCETSGQTEGFNFSASTKTKTKAAATFINEAIDALEKISSYKTNAGTKNPTEKELDTLKKVSKKEKVEPKNYNLLLSVLKIENKNVNSGDKLLGSYFTDLKKYINNYELNSDRCESCNAACQSGQSCYQGCGDICEVSCQTNCEGGICGCEVQCLGTCEYASQTGCGNCQAGGSCQSGCQDCYVEM